MKNNCAPRFSTLFLILACFFVTCLLCSNIIAGKLCLLFGITLPAAVVLFPLTYLFGDILTEVYGFRSARLVIWVGFGANFLMVFVFMLTLILPYPAFWQGQAAFRTVLGFTPRLLLASLAAYFFGEFANAAVLSRLKLITRGRWLWVRTIGSTIVGEGIDTLLFITVAFSGTMPVPALGAMILAQYLWKVGYEAAITPLTYWAVNRIKRIERLDVTDVGVSYNPFRMEA